MVTVTECCFVAKPSWFSVDWSLLKEKADCLQRELHYETASATQTKLFTGLQVAEERLFQHRVASYWMPHSARNFLRSAAVALNVSESDRGRLGGPTERQILTSIEEQDRPRAVHRISDFRKQGGARSLDRDGNPGRSRSVSVEARSVSGCDKQILEALESKTLCGDPTLGKRSD